MFSIAAVATILPGGNTRRCLDIVCAMWWGLREEMRMVRAQIHDIMWQPSCTCLAIGTGHMHIYDINYITAALLDSRAGFYWLYTR